VRNYLTITWGINFGFSNAERVSLNLAVASAKVKEAAAKMPTPHKSLFWHLAHHFNLCEQWKCLELQGN
jgi:hypothetical protein